MRLDEFNLAVWAVWPPYTDDISWFTASYLAFKAPRALHSFLLFPRKNKDPCWWLNEQDELCACMSEASKCALNLHTTIKHVHRNLPSTAYSRIITTQYVLTLRVPAGQKVESETDFVNCSCFSLCVFEIFEQMRGDNNSQNSGCAEYFYICNKKIVSIV